MGFKESDIEIRLINQLYWWWFTHNWPDLQSLCSKSENVGFVKTRKSSSVKIITTRE